MGDDRESMSCVKALITAAVIAAAIVAVALYCSGCKAFYENSGSRTRVGKLTAPVEFSDATDSITAKVLYSMDGADVYTRKDSKVRVRYDNCWTNNYIGCIETRGLQQLEVEVEPLYTGEDEADTNAVENVK